jgi:ABC-type transport system substrate-binding protein
VKGRRHIFGIAAAGAVLLATGVQPGALGAPSREGGIFRISALQVDYVDPALSYTLGGWSILDTTCAQLMRYPDKAPPEGLRIVPEVAAAFPKISQNGKTYTFTIRKGFRFSDGTSVRANAFARAINRTLAPGVQSAGQQFTLDIAGAADVQAGKTTSAAGVVARGNTLIVRFTRPVFDFAAKTTVPFFCAVPPTLPPDPEGVRAFPSAGPYVVTDYRPGERVTLRRNRFYGGERPHHVDGFDVDLRAASEDDVLEQVERGEADWGAIGAPAYFTTGRNLAAKYGVNKSRFFVKPGFTLRHIQFNTSRPLFRDNSQLRKAVSFAVDRRALARATTASPLADRLTDQYLPPTMPGFRDAKIYPLEHPDLRRARELAKGNLRGGKATFYVSDFPPPVAFAQLVKRQLAKIGIAVEMKAFPPAAYFNKLYAPGEPWDLTVLLWSPDFVDPFTYINQLFDPHFVSTGNTGRFDSPLFNRLMRKAARLQGAQRYRAYGDLDVRMAREAVPTAATSFFNEPTLVSERVGCIVLRPTLDLTAVCLK